MSIIQPIMLRGLSALTCTHVVCTSTSYHAWYLTSARELTSRESQVNFCIEEATARQAFSRTFKMSGIDLQGVHDFLIGIAYKAGDMIISATPQATGHGTKKNSADLVTETDQAVEKMVSTSLKEKYPDFECACLQDSQL